MGDYISTPRETTLRASDQTDRAVVFRSLVFVQSSASTWNCPIMANSWWSRMWQWNT